MGAVFTLAKPFDNHDFLSMIEKVLSSVDGKSSDSH
jgi:hypothetical protein